MERESNNQEMAQRINDLETAYKILHTQYEQIAEKLLDEKSKYDGILAAIGDPMVIVDRKYKVIYQNDIATILFGENDGRYCYDVYQGKKKVCHDCALTLSWEDGKIHKIEKNMQFSKEKGFVEIAASAVKNCKNEMVSGIMIFRDITKRVQTEHELRKINMLLQSILDSTTDAILTVDNNGKIVVYNHNFVQLWSIPNAIMDSHDDGAALQYVLDQLEQPDHFLDKVKELYSSPDAKDLESIHFKDGRIVERYSKPLIIDEDNVERVWFFRDITEKYRVEVERGKLIAKLQTAVKAADAANQAKSEFLANMSHELRTPLNAILGFAQLMQRADFLEPEHRDYLQTINRSGEHLLELINDVLEISKIEAGRISLESRTFDLHAMLQNLHTLFTVKTEGKGLAFILDIAANLPRYVDADENKFRQVLINLLGNAVKFTDEGTIVLRVFLTGQRAEEIRVMVEVEDTGPGIAAEELDKVFQVFEQTAAGRRNRGGTGLGMAISRDYVRMMGGDLTCTSREGAGSIFRFAIRARKGNETDCREKERHQVICLAPGQPVPRILVAEDTKESRILLVTFLKQAGFDVRSAENGAEALDSAQKWSPQFIWMDIRMPVMDGLEATRRIKDAPGGDEIKIVAVTASALVDERESILSAGCDDLVLKPYHEADIFRVMGEQLGLTYLYEQEQNEVSAAPETALSFRNLSVLPAELRAALLQAVLELDTERTLDVVAEITLRDGVLGPMLQQLALNLEYDRLLALLESDDGKSETV
ncbi:MAG: ATP-binding protein [Desulfobulbus sp.]